MTFEWLAPPPAETMIRALEALHALGALDDDARLSRPIGESWMMTVDGSLFASRNVFWGRCRGATRWHSSVTARQVAHALSRVQSLPGRNPFSPLCLWVLRPSAQRHLHVSSSVNPELWFFVPPALAPPFPPFSRRRSDGRATGGASPR
jgi:hypothetical protein